MNKDIALDVESFFPTITRNKKSKRAVQIEEVDEAAGPSRKKSKLDSQSVPEVQKSVPASIDLKRYDPNIPVLHQQPLRKPSDSEVEELEAAGFKIKRGRFSAEENSLILQNFHEYLKNCGGDYSSLFGVGCMGRKQHQSDIKLKQFYAKLARGLPDRHIWYVYLHARKICHPGWLGSKRKVFTPEETKQMLTMRFLHGNDYLVIAEALNRTPQSVCEHLLRVTEKKTGLFTAEDLLQLLMCVCDVHGLTDLNDARRLLWRHIRWDAVAKLMGDSKKRMCQDAWQHIVVPDCIAPSRAQLHFLCSLIRVWGTDDKDKLPWDQLAKDVGLLDGYIAQKCFQQRKFHLLRERYPDLAIATVPLRKAAKKMMKILKKKRNKSIRRFDDIDDDNVRDIPEVTSLHNMSWENYLTL